MKKTILTIITVIIILSGVINLFKPEHVKINEQITSACGVNSVYCD